MSATLIAAGIGAAVNIVGGIIGEAKLKGKLKRHKKKKTGLIGK